MAVVCVEGWRGINHSYALVNQWQLLHLLDRGLALRHRDLPFYRSAWAAPGHDSGFASAAQARIQAVPAPQPGEPLDLVYRIGFPCNLGPTDAARLGVFITAELQSAEGLFVGGTPRTMADRDDFFVVTPSQWSRQGLVRAGFAEKQVAVVPHGIDPARFAPVPPALRAHTRAALGLGPDAFVLLAVGAMTGNKGIAGLLLAYAYLYTRYPQLRLVLKDQSALYGTTGQHVVAALRATPQGAALTEAVLASIVFESRSLSVAALRALYGAADAYVAPYLAEGFSLTPLEAAACGVPIVVTAGGATDDYFDPRLGLQIESVPQFAADRAWRVPRLDALVAALEQLIEGRVRCGGAAGSALVHERFSWAVVVEKLVGVWGV